MEHLQTYTAPRASVAIGDQMCLEVIDIDMASSRINPVDRAQVKVRNTGLEVAEGQEIAIYLGLDSKLSLVFNGTVEDMDDRSELVIEAVDAMGQLRGPELYQAFKDCTPRTIGEWIFRQVGLPALIPADGPEKHNFILQGVSPLQALQQVDRSWDLGWDLYAEPEGVAYWGPTDQSLRFTEEEAYVLERGQNIISLTPGQDFHNVEIVYNPFLYHSSQVRIFDPVELGDYVYARIDRIRQRYANLVTELQCKVLDA